MRRIVARSTTGDAAPGALTSCVARRSSVTWVRSAGFTVITSSRGCAPVRVNRNARNKQVANAPSATIVLVRLTRTSCSTAGVRRLGDKGRVECTTAGLASLADAHSTRAVLNLRWTMRRVLDKRVRFHILARDLAARTYDRSRMSHVHLAAVGGGICWLAGCFYQECCALATAPVDAIR